MGLLDQFANLSPEQNQGLLAAAAQILQNSGPSRVPVGMGQALGTGLHAYQQTMEQNRVRALEEQRQSQNDAFNQEYRTAQMGGLKSQQAQREAEMKRMAGREEAARAAIVGGQLDMKLYAQKLAELGDPEAALDVLKQSAPTPIKYDTSPTTVTGPNGRPMLVQFASDGSYRKLDGLNPYIKPEKPTGEGNKPPAGYRWTRDGNLEAIPGGPASMAQKLAKAPTEFQGKSAVYGARAEEADRLVSNLKYNPAAIASKSAVEDTWLVGPALGAAVNSFAMSSNDQKAEQAQRDFINAVLRQESGAAIAESEFRNARRQYFPEVGDTKEKIEQKSRNRKTAIQGLKQNAGPAAYSAANPAASSDGWSIQKVN
ncbi:MAG TPA: hypothetical protein VGE56_04835 [Rhodocyclaceae bacterium]